MDSENLSSLIQLSVSDGQKTDSSKVVSVIGIYKDSYCRPRMSALSLAPEKHLPFSLRGEIPV